MAKTAAKASRSSSGSVAFKTKLKRANGEGTWTYISVPEQAMKTFAPRRRVPVVVAIEGQTYQSTIAPMGGEYCIPVRAEIRDAAGVAPGRTALVQLTLDVKPRTVVVPKDIAAALRGAGLQKRFDAMSFSHQKEYVTWILGAKQPETRARRLGKVIDAVRAKAPKKR